ncbi:hypothetical protein [Streptomyces lavendulocolor]|uniref:hypothetical protein n=1 Tax=Streptomyces lavendulocolor TaxID=67316 RepID=UPI003C2BEA01
MTVLSASPLGAMLGVPVWLALCGVIALTSVLMLVAVLAWVALRRTSQTDLPQVLLGLSHVISSLCGLLPWGKPVPPPALPAPADGGVEPAVPSTVVLVGSEPGSHVVATRSGR